MIKTCWSVFNPNQAFRRQCNSIAIALGITPIEKIATIKTPWCWLPISWQRFDDLMIQAPSNQFVEPWPDLLVACGKNIIPIALNIKRRSHGRTKIIFIQTPNRAQQHFDLVISPKHDHNQGNNVIETFGAVHDLTTTKLEKAKKEAVNFFPLAKGPYLSIFIGGTDKKYTLTPSRMARLTSEIEHIAHQYKGSLLITGSRRTGQDNIDYLIHRFKGNPRVFVHDGQGSNPYLSMLALADAIMVTNDSVSMISEACFTGKPVHILALPDLLPRKRIKQFLEDSVNAGYTRPFQGEIEHWTYTPLDEAKRIAPIIRAKLNLDDSAPKPTL